MGQLAHQLLLTLSKARWTRPPLNLVKVNFDLSFIGNTKCGAWGFVAKDDMGEFIAAAGWEAQTYPHYAPG
jgi:hypothetical protein